MKLIHLSDLHVGKRVNGFSMMEDQSFALEQINKIIDEEKPQGVLIAGDVYDRSVPPGEALAVVDDFLVGLSRKGIPVFMISGNHDSPERLAFGGRIMAYSGVYVSPVYSGPEEPVILEDEYGEAAVYLLPFVKPVHVRKAFPDEEISSYDDAAELAVSRMDIDTSRRNILVTHQYVTGAERSESEEISIGGADNISGGIFKDFDYVALGHLHKAQDVKSEGSGIIRYCGAPLAYSFSEGEDEKSVTVLEMGAKDDPGSWNVRTVPLTPLRKMRTVEGTFEQLTEKAHYDKEDRDDYIRAVLTDEDDIPGAADALHSIYRNLMKIEYRNSRTGAAGASPGRYIEDVSPAALMEEFFEKQNGHAMTDEQREIVESLVNEIWGDGE